MGVGQQLDVGLEVQRTPLGGQPWDDVDGLVVPVGVQQPDNATPRCQDDLDLDRSCVGTSVGVADQEIDVTGRGGAVKAGVDAFGE